MDWRFNEAEDVLKENNIPNILDYQSRAIPVSTKQEIHYIRAFAVKCQEFPNPSWKSKCCNAKQCVFYTSSCIMVFRSP